MPELLSPGVFIEEVPSSAQVIQAVSTSNMGIVGMAYRGPVDEATLVTSYPDYERTFGGLIRDSRMGLTVAAFFANGGARAYISRVVRSDACLANAQIQSLTTEQVLDEGDGATTAMSATGATSVLKDNLGASPIVPWAGSIKTRTAETPVIGETAKQRDGLTDLQTTSGVLKYEGRIDPIGLPTFDPGLDSVVRGTVTIKFTVSASPVSMVFTVGTSSIVQATPTVNGSTGILDHRTGRFSMLLNVLDDPDSAVDVTVDYTPGSAVVDLVLGTLLAAGQIDVTGAGLTAGGGIGNGSDITVNDGAWELDFVAAPANKMPILITYKINAWDITPVSKGVWGNDLRVVVTGNPNYYTGSTGLYTRWDVDVYLRDPTLLTYSLVESYEELDFDDSTSAYYFPDVVNDLSEFIIIAEPGGDEAPGQLQTVARWQVLAGGDEAAAVAIVATLGGSPIKERTVSIAWVDSTGTAKTITDDGDGNLTGAVDASGINTIVYATGVISFTPAANIQGDSLMVATFYSAGSETTHTEDVGDTTKAYIDSTLSPVKDYYNEGCEGTAALSRSDVSDPTTLETPQRGMYALDQVDEIMQVVIPDFESDVLVIGDELDWAERKLDKYIILTTPVGKTAQKAVDWYRYSLGRYSKFAAIYWPWVKVADPLSNNRAVLFPALGHIAGIYARTDIVRNVGKSPGGTVDGQLRYLVGLERVTTKGDRDTVYQNKINPLISSPQTGNAVWGVRQISLESEWRYINARRLFMFLEKSVYNATFWIVFENNGPGLWTRIKLQLSGFLNNLFNEGYFAGTKPDEAYFVICDETNNPQSSIDAGMVIIDIGVAPNKPAEFVRFRFQQKTLTS